MPAASEVAAPAAPDGPLAPARPFPVARVQSWEDPALLAGLTPRGGEDVLVCEPSGDDALALLAAGAAQVVVAAPDPVAAAVVELKRAAARELPIQSVRSLLGLGHFGRRVWFYHYLRPGLPESAQRALDPYEGAIRSGLFDHGALEREMAVLRERVFPLLLDRAAAAAFFTGTSGMPRGPFAGVRWRASAQLWAPRLARLAGAPSEGAAARLAGLLARTRPGFAAAWLTTGAWPDLDGAHPWLSAAGHAALKRRVAHLRVAVEARLTALAVREGYDLVILGRAPVSSAEATALATALRPGGAALGWSAGEPPSLPHPLRLDARASADLSAIDQGIFPGTPWIARRPG